MEAPDRSGFYGENTGRKGLKLLNFLLLDESSSRVFARLN